MSQRAALTGRYYPTYCGDVAITQTRTVRRTSMSVLLGPDLAGRATVVGLAAVTSALLLVGLLSLQPRAYAAELPVDLGTAGTYAVLAGTEITNTLTTTLSGDLGLSPGAALTGFPPGIVDGATHVADSQAAQARSDFEMAFDDAGGRTPSESVNGDLNGFVLNGGVYKAASALAVTGTLTLDAQDDPNAVFIFQVGSALNTGADSRVRLINGAQVCNVIWLVGGSATLGAASSFTGTILADEAVLVGQDTIVDGRTLTRARATLADNSFTTPDCDANPPTPSPTTATPPTPGDG